MSLYGALEAGGTKFAVAVGEKPDDLWDIRQFPTSAHPQETIDEVVRYFQRHGRLDAVGIASFGPVDYASGCITNTPKTGWQNYPLRDTLKAALNAPAGFETDVIGAALGEARYGAGRGHSSYVYITVGTGIGGGAIVNGQPVHGKMHPEMGHVLVRPHPDEPAGFRGVCPFHSDCLEGMACGPAIQARWGKPPRELPADHPAWRLEADYLAQACANLACILSPQAISIGGGVLAQEHMLPMVRRRLEELCGGYLPLPHVDRPFLAQPGLTGALVLAVDACVRV